MIEADRLRAAVAAARKANEGWHSDVGPVDYILPFLRELSLESREMLHLYGTMRQLYGDA